MRHAGALAAKGMAEALELTPSKEQAVLQVALATVTAVAAAQKSCAAGPSSATAPTVTPSRSTRLAAAAALGYAYCVTQACMHLAAGVC